MDGTRTFSGEGGIQLVTSGEAETAQAEVPQKGTMVQVARVRTHVHDLCLVGHGAAASRRRECVERHRCMYERDIPMRHEGAGERGGTV